MLVLTSPLPAVVQGAPRDPPRGRSCPLPQALWWNLWPNPRDAGFVLLYKQTRWGFACGDARQGALARLSLLIRAGFVIQPQTDLLNFNLDLLKSDMRCDFVHTPI